IEPEERHRFLGRDIRLAITGADRRAYEGDCTSPDFGGLVREAAAASGLDLTPEEGEQLWRTWNLEGSFFGRRLFDDAIETLEELRRRGYRVGCVTNRPFGGPSFVSEVEEFGLDEHFEAMAVSCDVGYMKPHPRIFEHALDALSVRPAEAVMVGDLLRADVAGAQTLGMTAVWRRRETREEMDGVRPDFVIDELRELLDLACLQPDGQSGPS
ncbi:MAG: HAD-IA family hydrolase, partial [Dehalococcoidia bacterium]|nr:HAD-IA family hydrolase [Dehalococcoidia bacterium]